MGMFNVALRVSDLSGSRSRSVEALVDTGTFYTMLPAALLREMEIAPTRSVEFELADGSVVEFGVGHAVAAIDGQEVITPVVFGPDGAEPLLGTYTLEGLRLTVDPVNEVLTPARRPRL